MSQNDEGGTQPMESLPDGVDIVVGEGEKPWGYPKLMPMCDKLGPISLMEEAEKEVTFGRGDAVSHGFNNLGLAFEQGISKVHFTLKRVYAPTSKSYVTQITDKSLNGTFVREPGIMRRLKRGEPTILPDKTEISLGSPKNIVFAYMEQEDGYKVEGAPPELTQNYIILREIGRGTYGDVHLAFDKVTCVAYAVKIVRKDRFMSAGTGQVLAKQLRREVEIMQRLDHPSIISIKDVFDSPRVTCIIMELVNGGELFDKVKDGPLKEEEAKFLFYQTTSAVEYLHQNSVTHRDLKPENILLSGTDLQLVKVTDFGLSITINEKSLMTTFCGTPNYLAPEVLGTRGSEKYTNKVDLWSLGVILYVCLSGSSPFSGDITSVTECATTGHYSLKGQVWDRISDKAKDLIKKLLTVEPTKRISASEALAHPWFQDPEMVAKARSVMFPTGSPEANGSELTPRRRRARESTPTERMDLGEPTSKRPLHN